MANFRKHRTLSLLAAVAFIGIAAGAAAQEASLETLPQQPVLVLEPGVHTAVIWRADVDAEGRTLVTASADKTVRVWSAESGALLRTIRLPQAPGDVGKAYSVAISPDGAVVAAGGWTTRVHAAENIYLFDAETGAMTSRIGGLPGSVYDLAFSPDGRRLAATMCCGAGLRFYDRDRGWEELARDSDYGSHSANAAFDKDGRLATTGSDGMVRLYDQAGRRVAIADAGGEESFGVAFSPDGLRLAVGILDTPEVRILDGASLSLLSRPDTSGIDNGDVLMVAWSSDGTRLYASGQYSNDGDFNPVVSWDASGSGPRREFDAGKTTSTALLPLSGGDLIVATGDPWLGRLGQDGAQRWMHEPRLMDARGQKTSFKLSGDGQIVEFSHGSGEPPVWFNLAALELTAWPPDGADTAPPVQDGLEITGWRYGPTPRLDGIPLSLEPDEFSRSLAIHPDGDRFVLGTEWMLRTFGADGAELWRREVPGVVWAVNISGDGRVVAAAYGDGTIRWHRMEDGAEILALFPLIDRANWVAWTPEGVYSATPLARSVLRWHVNHGWDAAGEAIRVSAIPETHRPEVIKRVLPQLGTAGAIAAAELEKIRGAIQSATRAPVPPGARLHLLTVGVSEYGPKADWMKLDYAAQDATDLATALITAQKGLYADILMQVLLDGDATRGGILSALGRMRANMVAGAGNDLAVVAFSGHGAMVNDMFYLMTHDADARDPVAIGATALSVQAFQEAISGLADHGRVIVLLDACHSGATTGAGAALSTDAARLRELLRGPNINVLTSSTADQVSVEDAQWRNGAFTEAVLEALTTRADGDGNGIIGMVEMTEYVAARVPQLTGDRQIPGIDLRFESDVFVAGL